MKATATLLSVCFLVATSVLAGRGLATGGSETSETSQTLYPSGSQGSFNGPGEFFTGKARVDALFPATNAAQFSGAYVTFEAGARSAWHTHPAGQHILVTAGVGRTQEWGGPIVEIKAGDVIWCPLGVKHWHGASPTAAMTHLVVTGVKNGKNVEWMEKVSDAQYQGR